MEEKQPIQELMLDHPIIAAVKDDEGLAAALGSECAVIFLLYGSLLNLAGLIRRVHAAGKFAVVHADLVEGLGNREVAADVLAQFCRPDGVISTRASTVRRARHLGLMTVQRAFILDSMSIDGLQSQLSVGKPDFVEILPGIMPRVIGEVSQMTATPVIAGGLIKYKEEVMAAMRSGAVAVSTSCRAVWEM